MNPVSAFRDDRDEPFMTPAHLEIQHILNEQIFRRIAHLLQNFGQVEKSGRPSVLVIQQLATTRKRLARRRHQPSVPGLFLVKLFGEVFDVDAGHFEGREVVLVAGVGDAVNIESGHHVGVDFGLLKGVVLLMI